MERDSSSLGKMETKKEHVSIPIVNEDNLTSSIKQKMDTISLFHYCVSRVPQELLRENPESYYPSLVSIGPFHYGKLKATEDKKWRYMNTLVSRRPNQESILDRCIKALRNTEQKARKFYNETIDMCTDDFIQMMLIDGCFIIELFLETAFRNLRRRDETIFTTDDSVSRWICDLILLENQVPFFILEQLFLTVPIPKQCTMSLVDLALYFFRKMIPGHNAYFPPQKPAPEIHHLLDLIRLHYLPISRPALPAGAQKHIDHATRLRLLGIPIVRATTGGPLDIKFIDGALKIPPMEIHDHSETLLGNLIAMEISHPKCSKNVTSYVHFIEHLIRTKRDVRLLQRKGILVDGAEREGQILILFKRLLVDIDVHDFYYGGICDEISGYKASKRRVCCESIRHVYDRTRLGIAWFSLVILILVFLFTGALFSAIAFLLHHFQ